MRETGMQRQDLWRQYILGELSPSKQVELDQLLIEDESALREYLIVFESMEQGLPEFPDLNAFTDQVMNALPMGDSSAKPIESPRLHRKWTWIRHPITHYTIAASITLLLITSGFFDRLTQDADYMVKEDSKSFSEQWLNQTTSWMDSWNKSK
ncbi:hypothetical protein [Paenibacillus sp. SN-8-1]|uniref:hypothetical protein n=1 Tax=Paenibacillus sp. SN-8-1 TaxID=3435409 RepID=UPI003D9A5D42